jgi:hypothetical protein
MSTIANMYFQSDIMHASHSWQDIGEGGTKQYRTCSDRSVVRLSPVVFFIANSFLVLGYQILAVGGGWEESELHENPNEYVEYVCDFMSLLWYNLTTTPTLLPRDILKATWEDLVGGGYMVLLDAFSKVPFCSTEGRSLMSMDLASYASGTKFGSMSSRFDGYPQTSIVFNDFCSYRSMAYVDTYIKLYYFPAEVSRTTIILCTPILEV